MAKWEVLVSTRIQNASADQIWPLITDFFGIHKYFPIVDTSSGIHGNNGEVGSIRHCKGVAEERVDDHGNPFSFVGWAKERILAVDPAARSLTYDIVDTNYMFDKSYVATMKVSPESSGCVLEWSFSVDPVEGFQLEEVVQLYELWVKSIGQNMEQDSISLAR